MWWAEPIRNKFLDLLLSILVMSISVLFTIRISAANPADFKILRIIRIIRMSTMIYSDSCPFTILSLSVYDRIIG